MSCTMYSTPRWSASSLPRTALSSEESRSGRISANTRSGPSARTASPNEQELSMPPDIATTRPRCLQFSRGDVAQHLADAFGFALEIEIQRVPGQFSLHAHSVCLSTSSCASNLAGSGLRQTGHEIRRTSESCSWPDAARQCALTRIASTPPAAFGTTKALIAWPSISSFTPTTATSATSASSSMTSSMSLRVHAMRARLDHVAAAAGKKQEAVGVEMPDVAGVEPAVKQRRRGRIRVVPVTLHHVGPARPHGSPAAIAGAALAVFAAHFEVDTRIATPTEPSLRSRSAGGR